MSDEVKVPSLVEDADVHRRLASGSTMRWRPPGDAADVPPWSWLVGWVDEVTP